MGFKPTTALLQACAPLHSYNYRVGQLAAPLLSQKLLKRPLCCSSRNFSLTLANHCTHPPTTIPSNTEIRMVVLLLRNDLRMMRILRNQMGHQIWLRLALIKFL